jgi:hypothetical protein
MHMQLLTFVYGNSDEDMRQEHQRGFQEGCDSTLDELRRGLASLGIALEEPARLVSLSITDITRSVSRKIKGYQSAAQQATYEIERLTSQVAQLRQELEQTSIPQLQAQIKKQQDAAFITFRQQLARDEAVAADKQAQAAKITELQRACVELQAECDRQAEVLYRQTVQLQRQQQQPQQQKR